MISSITKNAVFITGALFFFGFLKYQSYYETFSIDIYKYLTAFEVSKSFISIIIDYWLPILFIYYASIIVNEARLFVGGSAVRREYHKSDDVRTPARLAWHILYNNKIDNFFKLRLAIRIIKNSYIWLFLFFFMISFALLDNFLFTPVKWRAAPFRLSNEVIFYIISAIWLVQIWEPLVTRLIFSWLWKSLGKNYFWIIKGLNYFFIIVYFLYSSQKISAIERLNGEITDNRTISLKSGENLHTSKDLIFIGETQDYLFLRDKITKSNVILEKSEVKKMSILVESDPNDNFLRRPLPLDKIDSLLSQSIPHLFKN